MKALTVLPDGSGHSDGWLVLRSSPREVEVLDTVFRCVWLWRMAGDGIRVQQAVTIREPGQEHETKWVGRAISLYPPPKEVAEFLRRNRRR